MRVQHALRAVFFIFACSWSAAQDVPGFPGLGEDELDGLLDQASTLTGIPRTEFCVRVHGSSTAPVPALVECEKVDNPNSDCHGKFRLWLFPKKMREVYETAPPATPPGDYDWMADESRGELLATLVHELTHICHYGGAMGCIGSDHPAYGLARGKEHPNRAAIDSCNEFLIDRRAAEIICARVGVLCDAMCALVDQLAGNPGLVPAYTALFLEMKGLCANHNLIRERYNALAMQQMLCHCLNGDYNDPNSPNFPPGTTYPPEDQNCSIIYPPIPQTPGCNSANPIDAIPACPACGCGCALDPEGF
jgi:hypothetical protein